MTRNPGRYHTPQSLIYRTRFAYLLKIPLAYHANQKDDIFKEKEQKKKSNPDTPSGNESLFNRTGRMYSVQN